MKIPELYFYSATSQLHPNLNATIIVFSDSHSVVLSAWFKKGVKDTETARAGENVT